MRRERVRSMRLVSWNAAGAYASAGEGMHALRHRCTHASRAFPLCNVAASVRSPAEA